MKTMMIVLILGSMIAALTGCGKASSTDAGVPTCGKKICLKGGV